MRSERKADRFGNEQQHGFGNGGLILPNPLKTLERVKGIEPSSSAWKAGDKANEINSCLDFWQAENPPYGPKV
jgi:hypothetical protein